MIRVLCCYLASNAFGLVPRVDELDAHSFQTLVQALNFAPLGLQLLLRDLVRACQRAVVVRVLSANQFIRIRYIQNTILRILQLRNSWRKTCLKVDYASGRLVHFDAQVRQLILALSHCFAKRRDLIVQL